MAEAEPILDLTCQMSSIDLDPDKLDCDFEQYRRRMATLKPVINEALKHLDDIVVEYFGGKKELVVGEKDEEFIRSALEMRRKPVAVVLGQMNCGKSTVLNEIFKRDNLVPTSQHGCTARLVFLDYVDSSENEEWQLEDISGEKLGEPQPLIEPPPVEPKTKKGKREKKEDGEEEGSPSESEGKKKKKKKKKEKKKKKKDRKGCGEYENAGEPQCYTEPDGEEDNGTAVVEHSEKKPRILPPDKINLPPRSGNGGEESESLRDDETAVRQIVRARVHVEILKYGIQLVDSPGLGENKALNKVLDALIEQDLEPLIVYVIDGHRTWSESDDATLTQIRGRYPGASIMYVVNKIDFSKRSKKMDDPTDDEDDAPSEAPRASSCDGKIRRLSELEPKVMNRIKEKGFLKKEEPFLTSELFHCVSAKKMACARHSGKDNEFVEKFLRFEACFCKKMYERMKHLEGRVMNCVITLMEAFLAQFGKQRVGYIAAVNTVPDFVDKALQAETHLKTQFSRYVDDIIKDDKSIASTLEETKQNVKDLGKQKKSYYERMSPEFQASLTDKRGTLTHLWKLFDVRNITGEEEIMMRTKAAAFAVQIVDEVLRSIPKEIIEKFEQKMNERRDRFYSFVKQLRETLNDDCLNNLFEQAYRIRNKCDKNPDEMNNMRKIMSLTFVINTAQTALFDYVEDGMKSLTQDDLHLDQLTNMGRWRDQFIDSIFTRIQAESICGRLVAICSQKMDEMHLEFIRIISRVKHLREEAEKLGDEKLKNLSEKVKPPLFLNLCEVYSVQYEMEHGHGIQLGDEIEKDGCYTIHAYPDDDDLVVYVLKREDCGSVEEWRKRAIDIFHAHDIMRQTDTIDGGEPHPDKSYLVNCHGLWMPDRETFHVLFDKTDELIADYVIRKNLTLKQRLQLVLKVGHGLQLLHHIHYVHLDLRPSNIRMIGTEPKIHMCHWQSPCANIELHKSDLDATSCTVPAFHLHKDFQKNFERTDTTRDLDCYAFGTFLWIMCEGSFAAYPENFKPYKNHVELQKALEDGVLPERPQGKMVNEAKEHQERLYEIMECLWTQSDTYTMEIVNDRLAYMTGNERHSGQFHMYFKQYN